MSGRSIIYGELAGTWSRTARNGRRYLTVELRQPGAGSDLVIYSFHPMVIAEIEALPMGERIAVAGKLWSPRRARRPTIMADAILHANTKPRPGGKRAAQDHAARETAALPLLALADNKRVR
jgi:hypothetical protein